MSDNLTAAGAALALAPPSATLAAGAISDFYSFQRTEDAKLVTILALALDLKQDLMPAGKDLCIYADVVTFSPPGAKLEMRGRNLTISARRILTNGVTLDVSGRPPQKRFSAGQRATDGQPGQNGADGQAGARGQDAGAVTLVAEEIVGAVLVEASGGNGERGQDGGNGGLGVAGANGADAIIGGSGGMDSIQRGPEAGKKGGPGGRGGKAGRAGDGGNSGLVNVVTIRKVASTRIVSNLGLPGDHPASGPSPVASPGSGGAGGPGGIGGRNATCRTFGRWPDMSRVCSHNNDRAAGGPAGDRGPGGAAAPAATGGMHYGSTVQTTPEYLKNFFERTPAPPALQLPPPPVEHRQLVLHQAELRYLNGEFDQAVTLLDWLLRVTPSASTPPVAGRDMALWRGIYDRVISLLRQIRAGLNFYAKPENYVPLVSLPFYQKQLTALLDIALVLEDAYNRYAARESDQQTRRQTLETALKQVEAGLDTISKERDQVVAKQREAQDAIASLTLSVESQANAVLAVSQEFKDALVLETACENFTKMVSNIACFVKMGADAYATFQAIRGAYNQWGGAGGDSTLSNVIKEMKPVPAKLESIRESIGKIQSLNTNAAPDAGKLALSREDFDDMIKDFASMPTAQAYKTVMYNYLDGVQARNEKVVEYNALLAKAASLEEQIRQGRLNFNNAQDAISTAQDPTTPQFRTFMQGAYIELKSNVLRYLFEENQAYGYWALNPKPFRASDQTVAQLKKFHADLMSNVLDHLNGESAPAQPFEAEVRFTAGELHEQFTEFVRGRGLPGGGREHFLAVQIRLSQPGFADYSDVLAKSFSLELPGAKTTSDVVTIRVLHSGRAVFRNRDNRQLEFSHLQRETFYKYNLVTGEWKGGGNLGDEEGQESQIIGLSPFTTWTISLRDSGNEGSGNPGLDLARVSAMVFRFQGRCRLRK